MIGWNVLFCEINMSALNLMFLQMNASACGCNRMFCKIIASTRNRIFIELVLITLIFYQRVILFIFVQQKYF